MTTSVRSITMVEHPLTGDGRALEAVVELVSPQLAFRKAGCPERRQVHCRGLSLGDQLGQALAYGWAGLEGGAAIAGHTVQAVVLGQLADDGPRVRAHHQDSLPIAAHRAMAHDRESADDLLAAQ